MLNIVLSRNARFCKIVYVIALVFATSLPLTPHRVSAATEVVLAEDGKAHFPIIVSPKASEVARQNAETLASYLQKITGASFALEEGDGSHGIVLGVQGDFTALPKEFDVASDNPRRVEEYLLYSHAKGLLLVGATDLAAQNALWDFLGRSGYRQYFPGPTWEIVPSIPRLVSAFDEVQKPNYLMRTIWYSGGMYEGRGKLLTDWRKKNRMESGLYVNAGHSYEGILKRHKEVFLEHPEYLAMVAGKREYSLGAKFNIANPDLRKFIVEHYALAQFRKSPQLQSLSIDPSDGGGWDESDESKRIGSPSNQAITLANDVAQAVQREFPGRYIGLYAYNYHSEPPTIKIEPNVVVLIATAFRKTPMTLQKQMEGWAKQGASIGIRDYLSYPAMDYDVPSRSKGALLDVFAKNWKNYYQWGARLYSGEASDNWGINGLLYYTSSRVLWDVNDTAFIPNLREEFLANCFGEVKEEIRSYFDSINPAVRPILGEDLSARMYGSIQAAKEKTTDAKILERLDDLTMYARYLELSRVYSESNGVQRQGAAKAMFSHLYRAKERSVNHARGIIRNITHRDKTLEFDPEERRRLRAGTPGWEQAGPYEREEIDHILAEGLKNNARFDYDTRSYSEDLIPASEVLCSDDLELPALAFGTPGQAVLYYTWAKMKNATWSVTVRNNGEKVVQVACELWAAEEALEDVVSKQDARLEPGETVTLQFSSPHAGLHKFFFRGPRFSGVTVSLDSSKPWSISSGAEAALPSLANMKASSAYFYVPKGTTIIGGHFLGRGLLLAPGGEVVRSFDKDGFFKIEVPVGLDGRLWRVSGIRGGNLPLFSVPPYFAASPADLLLPREVVEADRAKK